MKAKKLLLALILAIVLVVALIIYGTGGKGEGSNSHTVRSDLQLNEVMTSNKGSVPDENGNYPDWVELRNTGDSTIDVGGFGLTDDITAGVKYMFPAGTRLEAGGYIVVWCSGENTGGLVAPFRLSANDSLVLLDVAGNTVDTLVLRGVASGHTLAKDGSGMWVEMAPSPGFNNDSAGIAAYEATLKDDEDTGVYINEFMASNATTILDANGAYSDWIELYNSNSYEVDLAGFGISDSLAQPKKYTLPEGTVIPAGGYLVIFCSGSEGFNDAGELHAPFGLRAYGEDIVLAGKRGTILDSYTYTTQETDQSMARMPDGTGNFAPTAHPTPGYPNDDAGYQAFNASVTRAPSDVYISEMVGKNISLKAAKDGEYYDLIELHNRGVETVSLSGWGLTKNPKNPAKWVFPEGTTIAPGEYLVVYASGLNTKASKEDLHTNFKLSATGASLYLFNGDAVLMDKLQAGAFLNDMSYGIGADGAYACFKTATPGAANGSGEQGVTGTVQFVTAPGIYDNEIEIVLSAPAGETIHYTLDCTTPTASSPVYEGPIRASKNTVVRAVSLRDGYITNYTVSGTFLFRSDEVNHSLPIVTLVTDPDNLWNSETGIYATGDNFNPDAPLYGDAIASATYYKAKTASAADKINIWEKPGSFSVFDENGHEVFSQNIGMRIAGSFGRGRAQKGFNIIARDGYGDNRMEYPFFENREYTEYKAIVLRAGAQDQNRSKIRDELCTGLLEGTDVNVLNQAYRPYVLYLNGEYWGVYFMKEKRNRFFVAQHENNGNTTDVDIIHASTLVNYGSNAEWKELMSYINSHDLSVQANYDYVCSQVDVDSFMDYMICEIYVGNSDYGNIQFYKQDGGKWKWIFYDFCWSFGDVNHTTLKNRRGSQPAGSDLFNALLKNAQWKDKFIRRFAELMDTVFAPERVIALADELAAIVEPEIERERAKFNQATFMGVKQHSACLGSYNGFLDQIKAIHNYAQQRPDVMKKQIQQEFGLSDAYMQEVFG